MKKGLMVFGLIGVAAATDALCAHPTLTRYERIGNEGVFDLVIYCAVDKVGDNNGNHRPSDDSQYSEQDIAEEMICHWADALTEASCGVHYLRTIIFYTGDNNPGRHDVFWRIAPGRSQAVNTIKSGEEGRIEFFERDYLENRAGWELGGYTLGHEGIHYLYGLRDEYLDKKGNELFPERLRVRSSIMNNQHLAANRNYRCLNLSIKYQGGLNIYRPYKEWENTKYTLQHHTYGMSCWETLAYKPKEGSILKLSDTEKAHARRPFYPELQLVAPKGMNPPPVTLSAATPLDQLESRKYLNIIWNPEEVKTVVIDKSSSMAGGGLDNAKAAACDLIDRVEDNTVVSILAFDASVELVHGFLKVTNGANRAALKGAVNGIALGSGTAIGDAARTALNNLVDYGLSNCTATVYLLSDGENNAGEDPYAVIGDLAANRVSFYGLGYGFEADGVLGQMALETGGAFVNGLAGVMEVKEAFIEANARASDRVIAAQGAVGAGVTAVDIPVIIDSTLTNDFRLTVNVSGGAAALSLAEPGGAPAHAVAGVPESDGSTTWDFWFAAPAQGVWRLTGTKDAGAALRYICDAKTRGGTYHLSLADAAWDEEGDEFVVLAWLGNEACTDGAAVTAQVTLTNGTVLTAACTNFTAGGYAAAFAGSGKWLFEGARVTVTAGNPNGEAFETWREATCGASATPDAPIAEDFTRVASMTVVWPRVKLTVIDGTGSGRYRPGEVVAIATNLPPGKFTFLHWGGDTQTVASVTSRQTAVTVTEDMTIRAVCQAASLEAPLTYMVVSLDYGGHYFQSFPHPAGTHPDYGSPGYISSRTTHLVLRRVDPEPEWDYHVLNYWDDQEATRETILTQFSAYYIGVFPVTQGQWQHVMGALPPSTYQGMYNTWHPAEQVSYADIRGNALGAQWPGGAEVDGGSFMGRLRARTGLAFDLPTEGQWNRAMQKNWKGEPNSEEMVGWTSLNSGGTTHEVGSSMIGVLGLYDMLGNVKEWCLDWFGTPVGTNMGIEDGMDIYIDPEGPASGSQRVQRGGSYLTSVNDTWPAPYSSSHTMRWGGAPSGKASDVGFRVALTYRLVSVTINGVTRPVLAGAATPVSAPDVPGQRFTGWSVDTTAPGLGDAFAANAPNTFVSVPAGASLTLTPLYEPVPPPPPPYHDVTYEDAPVLVKDFKVAFADGQVVLSWDALDGEEVTGYGIGAKAALTDLEWEPLFEDDGIEITEDDGHFTATVPTALANDDGQRYKFFQIRAVVERE